MEENYAVQMKHHHQLLNGLLAHIFPPGFFFFFFPQDVGSGSQLKSSSIKVELNQWQLFYVKHGLNCFMWNMDLRLAFLSYRPLIKIIKDSVMGSVSSCRIFHRGNKSSQMRLNLPQAKKSLCLQSSWERESKTWESQACLPRERGRRKLTKILWKWMPCRNRSWITLLLCMRNVSHKFSSSKSPRSGKHGEKVLHIFTDGRLPPKT